MTIRERPRPHGLGGAQSPSAGECAAERGLRGRRALADHTTLQSALVCPLLFNERFIGTIAVYHTEPSVYTDDHRRLLDRISEQAAAVIYNSIVFEQTQEDSLTDPLTALPNTRFMFMHLTRELARARAAEIGGVAAGHGPRQLQGHQRYLRPPRGRPRASRRGRRAPQRHPALRHLRALRGRRVHRRAVGLRRRGSGAEARSNCSAPSTACSSRRGRERLLPLAISIGAAVFPHDGETYETLLATADSRMYRDKARRKRDARRRKPGRRATPAGIGQDLTETRPAREAGDRPALIRLHRPRSCSIQSGLAPVRPVQKMREARRAADQRQTLTSTSAAYAAAEFDPGRRRPPATRPHRHGRPIGAGERAVSNGRRGRRLSAMRGIA